MMYFAEVSDVGSIRKAEPLKATNLVAAKREATRKMKFYGTGLIIGTSVNEFGFINLNSIVAHKVGDKWLD